MPRPMLTQMPRSTRRAPRSTICLASREIYRSSNSMPELTVLDLGSDPLERGRVHGRSMRAEIRDNFKTYVERFEAGGVTLPVVLEQSDAWAAFIARDNPEYAEEMAGVAEGAELSLTEVAMLNARYELTYCVFVAAAQSVNSAA